MRRFWIWLAGAMIAGLCGCSTLGMQPSVSVAPKQPVIAQDLTRYLDKRAVILMPREPVNERGLGRYFGSVLFTELIGHAPFRQVEYHPEQVWFGLQSQPTEEHATAAAIAAQMGFDLAVVVSIDRFVYSRNSESLVELDLSLIDTLSGETVHAQHIVARGHVGSIPPLWDVSLNHPVERDDLMRASANTMVRRMWVRWDQGETEDQFFARQGGRGDEEDAEEEY